MSDLLQYDTVHIWLGMLVPSMMMVKYFTCDNAATAALLHLAGAPSLSCLNRRQHLVASHCPVLGGMLLQLCLRHVLHASCCKLTTTTPCHLHANEQVLVLHLFNLAGAVSDIASGPDNIRTLFWHNGLHNVMQLGGLHNIWLKDVAAPGFR